MHGYKDAGTIVAEIQMIRAVKHSSFLLVEGIDDSKFWYIFKDVNCTLVDSEGKGNVTKAIELLDCKSIIGVLGIVDADYDHIEEDELASPNIVRTDYHDLECTLCNLDALERVALNYGIPEKIEEFESVSGQSIDEALLYRSIEIGRVRWASLRERVVLKKSEMHPHQYIDERTWERNNIDIVSKVTNSKRDETKLLDALSNLPDSDPWQIVNGHDVIEVLRLGLRHRLGNLNLQTSSVILANALRSAVSVNEINTTHLWKSIRYWEKCNIPFMILSTV